MSKLVFNKKELMTAVEKVIVATTDKSNIQILNNILMRPINGKIKVLASNLSVLFGGTVTPKSGKAEGEDICVEGRLLYDALKRIPEEEVSLETENGHIVITSGEARLQFQNYNSSDFPDGSFYKEEQVIALIKMKGEAIDKILKHISFCVGFDDNKPILKCFNFNLVKENLSVAALSGFQLGIIKLSVESEDTTVFNILGDSFKLLPALLKGCSEDITIKIGDKFAVFTCDNIEAYIVLNKGEYVNYTALFPPQYVTKIEGKRENIIQSLELVTLFKDKEGSNTKFTVADEKVRVSTQSNINNCTDIIKNVEIEGSDLKAKINATYLMSALKALDSENVRIVVGTGGKPFVIQVDNYVNLFMPLNSKQDTEDTRKEDQEENKNE